MDNVIISLNNVSKRFGRSVILDHVNLDIKKGDSIALLGHNGSGKSTLLRMICGLTAVTSGKIESAALKFNYVPEHFPKLDLTAREFIDALGLIEGLPAATVGAKIRELFHAFYMDEMIDVPVKHLSKGTIQKVAVIQALLQKPDVLLLDEPLSGQDSQSQKTFIKRIKDLNNQGVTVIMSCHEQHLVNQLSHCAYEIIEKNLFPANLASLKEVEYDVMVFDADPDKNIDSAIMAAIEQLNDFGSRLELIVRSDNSDAVLKQMLKDDFKLRSMGAKEV
ncbi:ATP-binding cassette domain-containing protein [Acetobacterium fimetarium]|uniref:ATP-binding cassette domain-containing protein n=1 Tax=Acetobacterium fimetarium TaxID=52691 RepID=A0ABR6WTT7_9FIRM|nr:ABC transporter ATP-binding protein [Acetobacterium fimetarium]MBC3804027.1 ATP-binding cassette domain-containing protein [Acetobacterium fimetarium]